ncbi:MAG: hypothetical protein VST71_08695 [Nitrospirota bacterium]|nr:hypothetical protein [Nitrospirota bacterium]
MSEYVFIDCNRIQEYVFASRRLKEICNASLLLSWIEDENIRDIAKRSRCKIIRAGGGVVIAECDSYQNAKDFEIKAINSYREYGISVTSQIFPHLSSSPADFYREVLMPMFREMQVRKSQPCDNELIISSILSVPCESSGIGNAENVVVLPGNKERRFNTSEAEKFIFDKKNPDNKYSEVEKQLIDYFKYSLPKDFGGIVSWNNREDIQIKEAGTSEKRIMGIIYADVNGLGKLTKNVGKNKDLYELFSPELTKIIKDSLFESFKVVIEPAIKAKLPSPGITALPVRVLYIGGDDLAVAIQGCFALDVASSLLNTFEKKSKKLMETFKDIQESDNDLPEYLTMSAGVVLAPYNYPIQNFNHIGKELETRAKVYSRVSSDSIKPSLIDFCLIKNQTSGDLNSIRIRRMTKTDSGNVDLMLYGGPYTPDEIIKLTETSLELISDEFPMNKLKDLAILLAQKRDEAKKDYKLWYERLSDKNKDYIDTLTGRFSLNNDLPVKPNIIGDSTPIVDIIEMMEIFGLIEEGG